MEGKGRKQNKNKNKNKTKKKKYMVQASKQQIQHFTEVFFNGEKTYILVLCMWPATLCSQGNTNQVKQ